MKVCHYNMLPVVHFITPSKFGGNSHNLTCFPAVGDGQTPCQPGIEATWGSERDHSYLWPQMRMPSPAAGPSQRSLIGSRKTARNRYRTCSLKMEPLQKAERSPPHMHTEGEVPSRLLKWPNHGTCIASGSRPPWNQQAQYVNWIRHETHTESVFDCFLHTGQLAKDTQLRLSYTCVTVRRWSEYAEYGLLYCTGFPAPREAASRRFCLSAIQAPPR